jgi:hypothetical protein
MSMILARYVVISSAYMISIKKWVNELSNHDITHETFEKRGLVGI